MLTSILAPTATQLEKEAEEKSPALNKVRAEVRGAVAGQPAGKVADVLTGFASAHSRFEPLDYSTVPLPLDGRRGLGGKDGNGEMTIRAVAAGITGNACHTANTNWK